MCLFLFACLHPRFSSCQPRDPSSDHREEEGEDEEEEGAEEEDEEEDELEADDESHPVTEASTEGPRRYFCGPPWPPDAAPPFSHVVSARSS